MKTVSHTFDTIHGEVSVQLWIFPMSGVEAIDVYELPQNAYSSGGFRIEGAVNGIPRGTHFYSGQLGSLYYGEGTEDAAREFLARAHQEGFFGDELKMQAA